jgi:hypothetical protein
MHFLFGSRKQGSRTAVFIRNRLSGEDLKNGSLFALLVKEIICSLQLRIKEEPPPIFTSLPG